MTRNRHLPALLIFFVLLMQMACQSDSDLNYARYYTNGKQLYDMHCLNCHNNDGSGLKGLIPPLTDTTFLRQNRERLACIIRHGIDEKIVVSGREYDFQMPANEQLPDIDVAALVTYITNTFGNEQGLYSQEDAAKHFKNCKH